MSETKVILLGPPASGKGTQAQQLGERMGIPCLGTGKLLRDEIEKDSEIGREAKAFIEAGLYVPDEAILKMVSAWLDENQTGWLMDGFPRTLPQAEALQEIAKPNCVIALHVPREDLEFRITKRRECDTCGITVAIQSPDETVCPECGNGRLLARADDGLDSFKVRYASYEELTLPLFDYYESLDMLKRIDGTLSPDKVFAEILNIVEV